VFADRWCGRGLELKERGEDGRSRRAV
jgi:hypothetical protein